MNNNLIVLDTHIWIWLAEGDSSLKQSAKKLIEKSSLEAKILLPAISIWELAMLIQKERITLNSPMQQWIETASTLPGLEISPLSADVSIESCQLPGELHSDPADRMIVATARINNATLITRDKQILDYGKQGYVSVVEG